MVIPPYFKLGKQARDLFTKDYNFGVYKVDVLSNSRTGVQYGLHGESVNQTGQVQVQLKTKYTLDQWGCTFTEKWTTENAVMSKVTLKDLLLNGSKVMFSFKMAPQLSKRCGAVQVALENDYLNATIDVDLPQSEKGGQSSLVFGYRGWLAGGQISFNPLQPSRVNKANVSVGFQGDNFQLVGTLNEGVQFVGSLHQNIAHDLDGALNFSCSANGVSPKITVGCLWRKDDSSQIKCRINTKSDIGVAYTRQLGPGLAITLSTEINATNIASNQGKTPKFGLGIQLKF